MKKPISAFITFAFLISFSIAIAGEPFAPKAALPSKGSEYFEYWEMNLSPIKVPDRASVGIPPYPGAKVIRFRDVGKRDLSGVHKTPKIFLITSDERDKVSDFYKARLDGWKHQVHANQEDYWTEDEYFSAVPPSNQDTPSVVIRDVGETDFLVIGLMPAAKTEIQITYKPKM